MPTRTSSESAWVRLPTVSRRRDQCLPAWERTLEGFTQAADGEKMSLDELNFVPKFVPDSTELSRTPWTFFALLSQIRLYRRLPARLIIRRSLVRVQPAP
jgi:hypothetical protein